MPQRRQTCQGQTAQCPFCAHATSILRRGGLLAQSGASMMEVLAKCRALPCLFIVLGCQPYTLKSITSQHIRLRIYEPHMAPNGRTTSLIATTSEGVNRQHGALVYLHMSTVRCQHSQMYRSTVHTQALLQESNCATECTVPVRYNKT